MVHQDKTNTSINRYPNIFKFCFDKKGDKNMDILSFGCSSGEELVTISMFFGKSTIYGVEIDEEMLKTSKLLTKNVDRIIVTKDIEDKKYDIIFCMSVLCRWPETENIEECSNIYSFEKFNYKIVELDNKLKIGGYMVIYNSNFIFEDSEVSKKYKPVGEFIESGFVHKFNKDNKKTPINYKNCVFEKQY